MKRTSRQREAAPSPVQEEAEKPHPAATGCGYSCNLQAAIAGIVENASPGRFMDGINTANSALGNRAFLRFVSELHATRKQQVIHGVAATGQDGPGRPPTHQNTLQRAFRHHDVSGMREHMGPGTGAAPDRLAPRFATAAAGAVEDTAPLQMMTRNMRKLLPDIFRFKRLAPATYAVPCNYPYKYDDTGILMNNYRQGGSTESGFSRPLSVVNRLAIAHLTGDDSAMLRTAYNRSWWPAITDFRPQRPSLQHLGLLLDEAPARLSGGRFLRYTSAKTAALSEGDNVVIPTFHPAELIQSPKMFGMAFDFLTRRLHFGVPTDVTEKVILELVIPDNHKLALPYGDFADAKIAYAPCLINPWLYTVDKISVIGTGFPGATNATAYDEREHAVVKFIRLKAVEGTDLHRTTRNTPSARNLYTGRNILLKDLLDAYRHLFHHRASNELPPIDMPH